jgi:MinD-like ATPase involved in chromosome partitioning or flagellar assembly
MAITVDHHSGTTAHEAAGFHIEDDGVLLITDDADKVVAAYAHGHWSSVAKAPEPKGHGVVIGHVDGNPESTVAAVEARRRDGLGII